MIGNFTAFAAVTFDLLTKICQPQMLTANVLEVPL